MTGTRGFGTDAKACQSELDIGACANTITHRVFLQTPCLVRNCIPTMNSLDLSLRINLVFHPNNRVDLDHFLLHTHLFADDLYSIMKPSIRWVHRTPKTGTEQHEPQNKMCRLPRTLLIEYSTGHATSIENAPQLAWQNKPVKNLSLTIYNYEGKNGFVDRRCGPTRRVGGRKWETLGAEKEAYYRTVTQGTVVEAVIS